VSENDRFTRDEEGKIIELFLDPFHEVAKAMRKVGNIMGRVIRDAFREALKTSEGTDDE
jgi:hypothetical protein